MADETRAVRTVETGEHKDRVLIVEDEDNARKGYEQLLQRWGYEVLRRGERGRCAGEVFQFPSGHGDCGRGIAGDEWIWTC